jgi:hypothetical protein
MNTTPGVKISSGLAKLAAGFIAVVTVGVFIWPHLWPAKASIPEVPVTHFASPPSPIASPSIAKLMPLPHLQPSAATSPKAQPTPCQLCIEAANEVLTRYLHAIRTGAGADNREQQRNTYESPQVVPNTPAPVWRPAAPADGQFHY